MSDILVIDNQGVLTVRRVQEKFYVGKKLLHISVLRPTDDWVFNMIYRDGKEGITYAKRFKLGGFTRDKEYQLTQGTKGSRVFFFTVHKTEEESSAMQVNVYLKNQLRRLRRPIPFDFGKLRVKGRSVLGNIVTKNQVERISRIMPSAAGEGEDGADAPALETPATPVGTLSALLDGSTEAPVAEPAPSPAQEAAPTAPAANEQQGLDDSIHEQMGFEF